MDQLQNCSESKDIKETNVFIYRVHQEGETLMQFQVFWIQGLEVAVVAFGLLGEIKLTGRATLS
jgi:hypothetical protein